MLYIKVKKEILSLSNYKPNFHKQPCETWRVIFKNITLVKNILVKVELVNDINDYSDEKIKEVQRAAKESAAEAKSISGEANSKSNEGVQVDENGSAGEDRRWYQKQVSEGINYNILWLPVCFKISETLLKNG